MSRPTRLQRFAIGVVATLLAAVPAMAVTETHAVQITYSGTLWGGSHDNAGLFGNAYSIDGLGFSLVYKIRYASFDPGRRACPTNSGQAATERAARNRSAAAARSRVSPR